MAPSPFMWRLFHKELHHENMLAMHMKSHSAVANEGLHKARETANMKGHILWLWNCSSVKRNYKDCRQVVVIQISRMEPEVQVVYCSMLLII